LQALGRELVGKLNDPQARPLVEQFLQSHQVMGQAYLKGLSAFRENGFDSKAGDRAVKGIDREPTKLLEQAAEAISSNVRQEIARESTSTHRSITTSLVIILLSAMAGFALFFWFARRAITTPMALLATDLNRLAAGNFSQPVQCNNRDEIGEIAHSAGKIQSQLGDMIRRIVDASQRLDNASSLVSDSGQSTHQAMQQQNAETGQVAVAMNQFSTTVQEIARNAVSAAEAADNANRQTMEGSGVVSRAVESISDLAHEMSGASDVIHTLESDSEAIGNVLDVIRGIAEQTNLLALNAAIEAARAGEQGRGFAVVADEVRNLANRTQESTQEIQQMIERIQGGSRNAVEAMDKGREKVALSVEQATQSGEKLNEILQAIRTINEMNTQIASAAEEQGCVAGEISGSIDTMNSISNRTSDQIRETTSASDDMDRLVQELKEMVGRFRL